MEATDDYVGTVLAEAIALHRQCRGGRSPAGATTRRRRSSTRCAPAASCWCSATAAAPRTRSMSRPNWSDGSSGARRPLAAIALTADTSVLTSVANDYGFDRGVRPAGRSAGPVRRCRARHQHQRSIAERGRGAEDGAGAADCRRSRSPAATAATAGRLCDDARQRPGREHRAGAGSAPHAAARHLRIGRTGGGVDATAPGRRT